VFGADRKVHAVLVGVRRGRRPAFGGGVIAVLARLARQITPVLDTLSVDAQAQQILDDEAGGDGLFRRQAVQAQDAPRWGDVVRVSPGWLPWAYWLLVGLLVASAAFIVFGTVATYSEGPAVIRSNARTPISARSAGNVVAVEVTSGDVAEPGTVIARLDDTEQRATVANLTQKFEAELRAHMLSNAQTNPPLATTRQLLADARAGLDERLIVATTHGVIGDLRVRAGQRVAPGDTIASVVDASMGLELTALLPGEDRPQLQPGMVLRLELVGYRYAFQTVTIDWVSPDVIAPAEARRVVGAEVAEGLPLTGPVVVVRGRLRAPEFELDGVRYRYHDGMMGQARVRVRAEPIVFALLPGTRRLSE
jgi:biotin carboxyl carrier protein